jgi:hypothetical protein
VDIADGDVHLAGGDSDDVVRGVGGGRADVLADGFGAVWPLKGERDTNACLAVVDGDLDAVRAVCHPGRREAKSLGQVRREVPPAGA